MPHLSFRHVVAAAFCVAALAGPAASPAHAVELNTANQAELEQVKGVGPQLSERLLQEREKGPFRDWADLVKRMKGVGPASARKLSAGGLTVAGAVYVDARAPVAGAGAGLSAAPGPTAPTQQQAMPAASLTR